MKIEEKSNGLTADGFSKMRPEAQEAGPWNIKNQIDCHAETI
jgi:hypothetical protein